MTIFEYQKDAIVKIDFRKILKAFEEEPEIDPEDDPERVDYKCGQGEPAAKDDEFAQRFCQHCEYALKGHVIGDKKVKYICNRGSDDCPWKDANPYMKPLTPISAGDSDDIIRHLDSVNEGLDDVIDSMESMVGAKKEKGTWGGGPGPGANCSKCGKWCPTTGYEYCPSCGSPMEEE